MKFVCAIAAAAGIASAANADVLYDADFSTNGIGFTHTTSSPLGAASGSVNGSNFTLSYANSPSTDSSGNYFLTNNGVLESADFGGDHAFESFDIDVTSFDEVTIDFLNEFLGTDSFNNSPTEFIEYYYTLDGGSQQQFYYFTDDPNGVDLNSSLVLDVSAASTLRVGLNANVNGGGDGFALSSATVTGSPVPAPGSAALLAAAGILAARRRRA